MSNNEHKTETETIQINETGQQSIRDKIGALQPGEQIRFQKDSFTMTVKIPIERNLAETSDPIVDSDDRESWLD